ncbi:MAG: hypothetical protein JO287_00955 [Pseudonocardiales bacterium]|nr:hypothetical protein [Pseudonocardiales bacterium]
MREGRRGAALVVLTLAVAACSTATTAGELTTSTAALPTSTEAASPVDL